MILIIGIVLVGLVGLWALLMSGGKTEKHFHPVGYDPSKDRTPMKTASMLPLIAMGAGALLCASAAGAGGMWYTTRPSPTATATATTDPANPIADRPTATATATATTPPPSPTATAPPPSPTATATPPPTATAYAICFERCYWHFGRETPLPDYLGQTMTPRAIQYGAREYTAAESGE